MVDTHSAHGTAPLQFNGRVWKFGSHIDTDVIIPARYLTTTDPSELARHCMEGIDPEFSRKCAPGDLIIAGPNFGCGSSREHAPIAIRAAGISCVIARNFARIFYRNALNIGLPIVEAPEEAIETAEEGDVVFMDLVKGVLMNLTKGTSYHTMPIPDFMQKLLESGGLIPYVRTRCRTDTQH